MKTVRPDDLWKRLHSALDWQSVAQRDTDPTVLQAKLAARAKTLRARMITPAELASQVSFLAFRDGRHRYGIRVEEVIEIQTLQHFTLVPRAPSFVTGVIQWRGEILTLLNLSQLLGLPQAGIPDYHVCIIVHAAEHRIAVVATEVEEIHSIAEKHVRPAPHGSNARPADWVLGLHDGNRALMRMDEILQDETFDDASLTQQ